MTKQTEANTVKISALDEKISQMAVIQWAAGCVSARSHGSVRAGAGGAWWLDMTDGDFALFLARA
jgi:hypothetical protein